MHWFIHIMPWMSIPSCEEVIALSSYHSEGGQHLKRIGLTHFNREQRLSFPTCTLWSFCCNCPFLKPRSTRAGRFIEGSSGVGNGTQRRFIAELQIENSSDSSKSSPTASEQAERSTYDLDSRSALSFYMSLLDSGSYRPTCLNHPHIVIFLPVQEDPVTGVGETEKGELSHAGLPSRCGLLVRF